MQDRDPWPDRLSEWTLLPGEVEPVRVFESAEAAMAFLARQSVIDLAKKWCTLPSRQIGKNLPPDESRRASQCITGASRAADGTQGRVRSQ